MGLGPGGVDAQGVWLFGEDDDEGLASDTLNLLAASISAQFGLDRARLTAAEDAIDVLEDRIRRGRETFPASSSAVMKTRTITFDTPFPTAPAAVVPSGWVNPSSGTVYGAIAESVTATGFVMRVATASGVAWSGAAGPFDWVAIQ